MQQIEVLQALLDDVKGNSMLRNPRKMSGYLKSLSLLADALARRTWQDFELGATKELEAHAKTKKVADKLQIKNTLTNRERDMAELQVKVAEFCAGVDCGAYFTKKIAADSLRKIAEEIEAGDSNLFMDEPVERSKVVSFVIPDEASNDAGSMSVAAAKRARREAKRQ